VRELILGIFAASTLARECLPPRRVPAFTGIDAKKPAPGRTSPLEGIQVLRAVAALLVVLPHTLFESRAAVVGPKSPDWLVAFGIVGVDFFFVISGFIMRHGRRGRFEVVSMIRRSFNLRVPHAAA
jgi:peptidoglycan/LPS O-acetylase OafA/YrhL